MRIDFVSSKQWDLFISFDNTRDFSKCNDTLVQTSRWLFKPSDNYGFRLEGHGDVTPDSQTKVTVTHEHRRVPKLSPCLGWQLWNGRGPLMTKGGPTLPLKWSYRSFPLQDVRLLTQWTQHTSSQINTWAEEWMHHSFPASPSSALSKNLQMEIRANDLTSLRSSPAFWLSGSFSSPLWAEPYHRTSEHRPSPKAIQLPVLTVSTNSPKLGTNADKTNKGKKQHETGAPQPYSLLHDLDHWINSI